MQMKMEDSLSGNESQQKYKSGVIHRCNICDKIFKTKEKMSKHIGYTQ